MQYKYAIQQEMGIFITPVVVCEFDFPLTMQSVVFTKLI